MAGVVGLGLDLVEVDRVRQALARTPGFSVRVFTDGERAWAEAASDPAERFAARWAAKEAVLKALGVGLSVPLRDIEVVRAGRGEPSVELRGRAAELAAARGVDAWQLSLTHTATTAGAVALALSGVRPSARR